MAVSGKGSSRTPAGRQPRQRRKAPASRRPERADGVAGAVQKKPGRRAHLDQAKKKQLKRPAETSAGLAGVATVLVSFFGIEGDQADEVTAGLAAVVGVVPLVVSKFVDWRRESDMRAAKRLDLMEQGVAALVALANGTTVDVDVQAAAAAVLGDQDPDEQDDGED